MNEQGNVRFYRPIAGGRSIRNRLVSALQNVRRRRSIWQQPTPATTQSFVRYGRVRTNLENVKKIRENMKRDLTTAITMLVWTYPQIAQLPNPQAVIQYLRTLPNNSQNVNMHDPMVRRVLIKSSKLERLRPGTARLQARYLNTARNLLQHIGVNPAALPPQVISSHAETMYHLKRLKAGNRIRRHIEHFVLGGPERAVGRRHLLGMRHIGMAPATARRPRTTRPRPAPRNTPRSASGGARRSPSTGRRPSKSARHH